MRSRHDLNDGSGKWGVFDAGVMGWRSTDLSGDEAHEQAADLNATLNQYGRRAEEDRREVNPPIAVELATWSVGGTLDWVDGGAPAVAGSGTRSRRSSEVDQSC